MKKIVIGTRGSKLALIQSEIIKNQLLAIQPSLLVEIMVITTKGDTNMNPIPLDSMGKDWFTKEIDNKLLNDSIDIAVHSIKDISENISDKLFIAAVSQREDAREALISNKGLSFDQLPKGSIIGTDSSRRKAQILYKRPDLIVLPIRGNIPTRIAKLESQHYDALVLAVAGLKRLGIDDKITQYFPITEIIPSPGQGALGIMMKKNNTKLLSLIRKLNHKSSELCIEAERACAQEMGGGCKMPVGVYAELKENTLHLLGVVGSLDGKHIVTATVNGEFSKPAIVGKLLAQQLLKLSVSWYQKSGELL